MYNVAGMFESISVYFTKSMGVGPCIVLHRNTLAASNSESGALVPHQDVPSSHPDRRPHQRLSLGSQTCSSHMQKSSRNKTFSTAKKRRQRQNQLESSFSIDTSERQPSTWCYCSRCAVRPSCFIMYSHSKSENRDPRPPHWISHPTV